MLSTIGCQSSEINGRIIVRRAVVLPRKSARGIGVEVRIGLISGQIVLHRDLAALRIGVADQAITWLIPLD